MSLRLDRQPRRFRPHRPARWQRADADRSNQVRGIQVAAVDRRLRRTERVWQAKRVSCCDQRLHKTVGALPRRVQRVREVFKWKEMCVERRGVQQSRLDGANSLSNSINVNSRIAFM